MSSRCGRGMMCGLAICAAVAAGGPRVGLAGPATTSPPTVMAVLGNDSYYRAHCVFKTPVLITPDGQLKVPIDPRSRKKSEPIGDFQSPLPPAEWMKPAFDDSRWDRHRAPLEVAPASATGRSHAARHSATVSSLICVRGRFIVDDPAKAQDLKLSLEYVGGVVVYVNGQELTRAHLAEGPLAPDTLAEKYPDDLYCEPGGKFLQFIKKNPKGFARRYRRLTGVAIPPNLLRKGTNVLAVEVHRSPINQAAIPAVRIPVSGMYRVPGIWAYAGLKDLSLTAAPGSAVTPNVARPKGPQVWNCLPFDTIEAIDYGDPGEPLRPIAIPAARNGVFSGRLVVSSDQAIAGLKVTVTDLVQREAGGAIPSSAVRVRCAAPAVYGKSWNRSYRFDALVDGVPADVPVVETRLPGHRYLGQPLTRPNLTSGALAPIWVTVRVPRDAEVGRYEGTVTVQAEGLAPTVVPVHLTVHDWTLPDPKDLRVRNLGFLSPESVAQHYGVPLWSDRHFELMGKSMALMAEVNSRQIIVNLAIGFYGAGGNRQSMVRWIRNSDGSFTHDYTVLDAYLDLIARTIGKPLPIRFNCWGEVSKDGTTSNVPTVSLLDPATGKVEPLQQPVPGTPESYTFWKPVFDGLRQRLEARGWFDVASIGDNRYCGVPNQQTVSVCKKLWPDGVWSSTQHGTATILKGVEKADAMPCLYHECVWTEGRLSARGYRALFGKRRHRISTTVARNRHRDYSPLTVLRKLSEEMIMRGHDGVGQLGVDIFPIPHPKRRGRYHHLTVGRGGLGPRCSTLALLFPGTDGPIPTGRFEMFREGVQLAEAILFLQRALDEKRITGELAERVNRYLDERAEAFLRHWSAGRFERDALLLALAAEVAASGR